MRSLRETALEIRETGNSSSVYLFKFASLFNSLSPFRATDPRDKVYALLSLSKVDLYYQDIIQADYKVTIPQCYAKSSKSVIADLGNLELLAYVHDRSAKKIDGLPSWVPDYSLDGQSPLFHTSSNPTGQLKRREVSFDCLWNQLGVAGVSFDVVVENGTRRHAGGPKKIELDPSLFDLLLTLADADAYQGGQTLSELLWRTLCIDLNIHRTTPAPQRFGQM